MSESQSKEKVLFVSHSGLAYGAERSLLALVTRPPCQKLEWHTRSTVAMQSFISFMNASQTVVDCDR
jgi:hypothetical protein